jgi:Uncharacterized protein conserved in bacteria (DUF2325)
MLQRDRIRVAVVGGLSRAGAQWSRAGQAIGVELEHHDGRTRGRRGEDIVAAVRRADVVVIITDPNSHAGVALARRAAISAARPHLLIKHLRPDGLGAVLGDALALARTGAARS